MDVLKLESLDAATKDQLLNRPSFLDDEVKAAVSKVIDEVKCNGDAALEAFTQKFDQVQIEALRVSNDSFQPAFEQTESKLQSALTQAKSQLERFHEKQRHVGYEIETGPGVQLGQLVRPFKRVGIYTPKNLVSSLMMAAIPAKIAGVRELVVCTPPQSDGNVPETMKAAAALLDIDELYAVGGAQAVAAMAYGTESIQKMDKIVGPGNAYVSAAKALVRDEVSIDMLAGPSEVLLVVEAVEEFSDEKLSEWILLELRAQLEHGPGTSAMLVTNLVEVAESVASSIQAEELENKNVAVISYQDSDTALKFVNDYAPEHLCLWGASLEHQLDSIQSAGSIFLGPWSPVAMGDYTSGTNHILPTARQARISHGLSVRDFVKTISYQRLDQQGLASLADTAITLAEFEGLERHADSVRKRWAGAA